MNKSLKEFFGKFFKTECIHYGDIEIFGLIPVNCYGLETEKFKKILKEKKVVAGVILDDICYLYLEKEKDIKLLYVPITDYSIPLFTEMNDIINFIIDNIEKGKVIVTCTGGHGRTGVVLAVWAGLNDMSEPVEYVREKYCKEAIETLGQEMFVNTYLKYIRKK